MTAGWTEIFIVTFTAQLAVLPGEKVQFIIAGLSTKYNPWTVVGAAGSAFAIWTVIELQVGAALKGTLPQELLDVFTAFLFLLFAVLLYRSIPDDSTTAAADGGIMSNKLDDVTVGGYEAPQPFGGFLPIFALIAAGEFGDKTQLITIGLATQYGPHPGIWFGKMAAIVPVSILNAFFFNKMVRSFDVKRAYIAGAILFAFFGFDTLLALITGFSFWESAVEVVSGAILSLV